MDFQKWELFSGSPGILKNEGVGDDFLGWTQEKSQILKFQLSQKKEQKWNVLQISFVMYCYLMHFYHEYHVWTENMLQILLNHNFPDFG